MNVVIFGKGFGKLRQLSLSGLTAGFCIAAVAGIVMGAGFAGGYLYSSKTGSGVSNDELTGLLTQIERQKEDIATIRQGNEDTLDAPAALILLSVAALRAIYSALPDGPYWEALGYLITVIALGVFMALLVRLMPDRSVHDAPVTEATEEA